MNDTGAEYWDERQQRQEIGSLSVKNGGPAFPSHGSMGEVTHEGMTLRDYFAAQAMQTTIHIHYYISRADYAAFARDAYEIADAMLAAREE